MTPAQIAKIMALVRNHGELSAERAHYLVLRQSMATIEAALRDAPQVEGWVLVPVDVLKAASESLGSFVSDHGWGDADMQAMDNLDAYLAARPSAPTAVEPDERDDPLQGAVDWFLQADGEFFCVATVQRTLRIGYNRAKRLCDLAKARASKGTP